MIYLSLSAYIDSLLFARLTGGADLPHILISVCSTFM